jgi:formate dehydrogenase subunit delta
MMANQIARNLAIQGEERAIALTADHIAKFWDPRMRASIRERLASGGDGLDPLTREAVTLLAQKEAVSA